MLLVVIGEGDLLVRCVMGANTSSTFAQGEQCAKIISRPMNFAPSLPISLWFEARVQETLKGLSENISLYGNRTVTLQSGSRSIQKGNLVLPRVPTAY